jgi:uroporphyrinogen III methyltransferase/synthase
VSGSPHRAEVLAGRRVVVTRARAQAGPLRVLLEAEGAEVVEFPTIRIAPPDDPEPLDRAIRHLDRYAWVVFTSRNAVEAVCGRIRERGEAPSVLVRAKLAAIGPGTAEALRSAGLSVELAPDRFVAEALVDAFGEIELTGQRVLLPRAASARGVLPDGLRARGAAVDVVAAYRTDVERDHAPELWRRLRDSSIHAVTFTSSSTVTHFVELLDGRVERVLGTALVACIGPVTAETAERCGLRVGVVARDYTIRGLVAALCAALAGAAPASAGG